MSDNSAIPKEIEEIVSAALGGIYEIIQEVNRKLEGIEITLADIKRDVSR